MFRRASFRKLKFSKLEQFPNNRFEMTLDFLRKVKELYRFKAQNDWFRGSWTCPPGPNIMEMMTLWVFVKWKLKVTSPIWSRIILRSFLPFQSSKHRMKMTSQTPTGCVISFWQLFIGVLVSIYSIGPDVSSKSLVQVTNTTYLVPSPWCLEPPPPPSGTTGHSLVNYGLNMGSIENWRN